MDAKHTQANMDAAAVDAYVRATYPQAHSSPLAQLFGSVVAHDEANRAIECASLQARATARRLRSDAFNYALSCIETCNAQGVYYDEETLSHNIESNFSELDTEECDEIAINAIAKATGAA